MITQQQRQERKKGIGGSDMPIILGLSSYKTPYQLYLEKTGLIEPEPFESPLQYWGNVLEPIIVKEFRKRNPMRITYPDTITHPFHDFLRANVDGYIPRWKHVLEVKCSNSFMAKEWGEPGSDVIPMTYLCQVAHYVSCMNAKGATIAVLIGGNDYREYTYTRDLELEHTLIKGASDFWQCVQDKNAPSAQTINDLKLMFPLPEPEKSIEANNDALQTLSSLTDTKSKMKELQELKSHYKFQIMEYMKDAECLTAQDGKPLATWKANKKGARTLLIKG